MPTPKSDKLLAAWRTLVHPLVAGFSLDKTVLKHETIKTLRVQSQFGMAFAAFTAFICAVAAWISPVSANTTNIIPYTNSFETIVAGTSVIGTNGWSAGIAAILTL